MRWRGGRWARPVRGCRPTCAPSWWTRSRMAVPRCWTRWRPTWAIPPVRCSGWWWRRAEGMRLLVIDDSATIRKLVEISFRGSAWVLEFAGTGADGLARAAQGGPTMILLDYVLPDMKAAEVCKR